VQQQHQQIQRKELTQHRKQQQEMKQQQKNLQKQQQQQQLQQQQQQQQQRKKQKQQQKKQGHPGLAAKRPLSPQAGPASFALTKQRMNQVSTITIKADASKMRMLRGCM
jgi:hypothetical protein